MNFAKIKQELFDDFGASLVRFGEPEKRERNYQQNKKGIAHKDTMNRVSAGRRKDDILKEEIIAAMRLKGFAV